jgi:hypothetical protein
MSLTWPAKDPDEVLDYKIDWADRLNGDTITASTFTLVVAAGLVIDTESNTATTSTVWLSAGTAGSAATLRCRVETTGGRTMDEEISLAIDSELVVEDGTNPDGASAFAAVETADAYCQAHGLAWTGTKVAKKQALRRGAAPLNTRSNWKGYKTHGRAQWGAWPRVGADDAEGETIASDEIPVEVVHANIELAVFELANPGGLTPAVVVADRIKREKIMGLETEYAAVPATADASRPVLTKVGDLLSGLLSGGGGNSLVGTAVRS